MFCDKPLKSCSAGQFRQAATPVRITAGWLQRCRISSGEPRTSCLSFLSRNMALNGTGLARQNFLQNGIQFVISIARCINRAELPCGRFAVFVLEMCRCKSRRHCFCSSTAQRFQLLYEGHCRSTRHNEFPRTATAGGNRQAGRISPDVVHRAARCRIHLCRIFPQSNRRPFHRPESFLQKCPARFNRLIVGLDVIVVFVEQDGGFGEFFMQ